MIRHNPHKGNQNFTFLMIPFSDSSHMSANFSIFLTHTPPPTSAYARIPKTLLQSDVRKQLIPQLISLTSIQRLFTPFQHLFTPYVHHIYTKLQKTRQKYMIKMVRKLNFALMSSFLCLLAYRLFPYFFISNPHLPGSLEKKSIFRQTPKKYFRFLILVYLCITTPAFPIYHNRKVLRTHTSAGKTLNSWFAIYHNMCCRCTSQSVTCTEIS